MLPYGEEARSSSSKWLASSKKGSKKASKKKKKGATSSGSSKKRKRSKSRSKASSKKRRVDLPSTMSENGSRRVGSRTVKTTEAYKDALNEDDSEDHPSDFVDYESSYDVVLSSSEDEEEARLLESGRTLSRTSASSPAPTHGIVKSERRQRGGGSKPIASTSRDHATPPPLTPSQVTKKTDKWWASRKIDSTGDLATALQAQLHAGDHDGEGVIWPHVAELSLLGGIGCGGWVLQRLIERLETVGEYEYVVCQATENAVPFYEANGFVRVGAVARYSKKRAGGGSTSRHGGIHQLQ